MSKRNKLRNFGLLYREIIKVGYCAVCGACEGVCPVNAISINHYLPKLDYRCINCGACVDVCLRFNQRLGDTEEIEEHNVLGEYIKIIKAVAADENIQTLGQNGGVVTALLLAAFEVGNVDIALVTGLGKNIFSPKTIVAKRKEEIIASARSKYAINPLLSKISSAKYAGGDNMAIVGLPCHLESLTHIIKNGYYGTDKTIRYKIGLLCMRSYYDEVLQPIISHETGLSLENILRTEIRAGELIIETSDGMQALPLKKLKSARAQGCSYCKDLTNIFADVAIGNIGVEDQNNVIFVRTERGKELVDLAIEYGYIKTIPVDKETEKKILNAIANVAKKKLKYSKDMPKLS